MEIKRFELDYIKSNMYIVIDEDEALIIDPNISDEGIAFLKRSGVKKSIIILTHEHFDHTTGVNLIRDLLPVVLVCQNNCAVSIANKKKNRPLSLMIMNKSDEEQDIRDFFNFFELYECYADIIFEKDYDMNWKNHKIRIVSTPGHSKGSVCIELDEEYVFTGDSLIPDIPVITRFPGGSLEEYQKYTLPYLKRIALDKTIMPGHGEICGMKELEYTDGQFQIKNRKE